MKLRLNAFLLIAAMVVLFPAASFALMPYSQDFEGLDQANVNALAEDGWLVFGNVFGPDGTYWYGYGVFPAPNDGSAFCAIVQGEGGAEQGAQQLSVFSDYNNTDHGAGAFIEANVFQEQTIMAGDVGSTWMFSFQAKRGNIEGQTTAVAFIKTLDPNNGFALTNFITIDMTSIPDTWGGYDLSIAIDASLEGQILQFGFASTATLYQGSGIFYDNIHWSLPVGTQSRSLTDVKQLFR
jgi:hypothetical protein